MGVAYRWRGIGGDAPRVVRSEAIKSAIVAWAIKSHSIVFNRNTPPFL